MRDTVCHCAAALSAGGHPDAETQAGASSQFSPQCCGYGVEGKGGSWRSLCFLSYFLSTSMTKRSPGHWDTDQLEGRTEGREGWCVAPLSAPCGKTTNSPTPICTRALEMNSCWGGQKGRRDILYLYRRGPGPKEGA